MFGCGHSLAGQVPKNCVRGHLYTYLLLSMNTVINTLLLCAFAGMLRGELTTVSKLMLLPLMIQRTNLSPIVFPASCLCLTVISNEGCILLTLLSFLKYKEGIPSNTTLHL